MRKAAFGVAHALAVIVRFRKFATAERRRQHAASVRSPDSSLRAKSGSGAFSSCATPVRKASRTPERLQPAAQDRVMLLRQDLRRRHERGLKSGLDRQQHRADRDHRFARSRHRPAANDSSAASTPGRAAPPRARAPAPRSDRTATRAEIARAIRRSRNADSPAAPHACARRDAIIICIAKNSENTRCSRAAAERLRSNPGK